MLKESITFNLFGRMTIIYQDNTYNLEDFLTKQSLDIIKVLILNYKKPISNDWIIQMFWKESHNPMNSLKYSIFRLRKSLKSIPGLENKELIKTIGKGYELNPDFECIIDTFYFQEAFNKISSINGLTLETLLEACTLETLYVGNIKVDSNHVWFLLMEEHFKEIYLKIVKKLCIYYLENKDNDKLKKVARKAATLEPMIEDNHYYYMQSLINSREITKAFTYYQKSTKMLIDEYALSLSDKMISLYNVLIMGLENKQNSKTITAYFKKKEVASGALYCSHSLFDYIYDIRFRDAHRTKQTYYLFVFEIKSELDFENLLPKIKLCFQKSLRSGDVITRINKYQFLVLLPCKNDDIAHMIARRISSNFRKKITKNNIHLFYNLETVIN